MRVTIVLLHAVAFATVLTSAQTQTPSVAAVPDGDAAVIHSERLYGTSQYADARVAATRALALYEQAGDAGGIARASLVLGLVAGALNDPVTAKTHLNRTITLYEQTGYRRGRALGTLGLLSLERPSRDEEARLYQRTVDDARAADDGLLLGRTFHSWGDHLFTDGRYEQALEKLDAALVQFEAHHDPNALGTVHNSIGRLFRAHGRLDLALTEQLKALALHEKSPSSFQHLQSLNAVAVTYQSLGDPRARKYFERALQLAEASESIRVQDFVRANFAGTLIVDGDYAAAAQQLETVIAHGLDTYPAIRHRSLSMAYLHLGRRADALAEARKAVEVCRQGSVNCINALAQRAKAYAALGDKPAAAADRQTALAAIEDTRARLVPRDFLRQQFTDSQRALYGDTIALQLDERDLRGALESAELARSRAFLDLLAGSDVPGGDRSLPLPLVFRGAPSTPGAAAPAGGAPLDLLSPASTRPLDADGLIDVARRLKSALLMYWVADDAVFIWVVKPDGDVRSARVTITRSKLRDLIRATSTFADQAMPSARGTTFTARGDSRIALSLVSATAWRELYAVLVRPIRDALPPRGSLLTIVPDDVLTALSFAALQNERGRYLLEDHALHYVPAVSVLPFTAQKRRPDARRANVALIADPVLTTRSRLDRTLPPLPGARAEVRAIARLFPHKRSTTVEGAQATEGRVRQLVADSGIVHFATHAIVTDQAPFASFLALTAPANAGDGDGTLTASEVYGLKLDADLVVLSACRSGGGAVTGDGIATFARAFIYAGTASLMTSLWDVADEPTNRLLPAFYRAWLGGASKAAALRLAQLQLLEQLRAGNVVITTPVGEVSIPEHPAFWAGFALIGEPD